MCIWNCEIRHCEYCAYEPCGERLGRKQLVADDYIRAMEDVTNIDFRDRRRHPARVWARNMVAYQMFFDGFTTTQIGNAIGKARCTITHCVGRVQDMLDMPFQYPEEMEVWKDFQKKLLSLQQNS